MGYEVHIHRREHWSDDGNDIDLSEWVALIAADKSLEEYGHVDWKVEGSDQILRTPTARWIAENGEEGGFWFYRGSIQTKNPSVEVIKKAWDIAQRLGARVEGDDGEFYRADGAYDPVHIEPPKRSLWSRLLGG